VRDISPEKSSGRMDCLCHQRPEYGRFENASSFTVSGLTRL
jgi:hypothetical protein